jgi:hypothetical protein
MDRPPSMRWIRRLVTVMQANHARDSQDWRRRFEGPPKPHAGRRS